MLQKMTTSEVEKGGGITWEPEPPLSAIQYVSKACKNLVQEATNGADPKTSRKANQCHRVEEIENRIGGGLIEEVIQVAEGERKLVDTMLESRV